MRIKTALFTAALLAASPLPAQTPSTGAPPKPPAHQPGVAAQPAPAPSQTEKATTAPPAAPADKPDPAKEVAIRHLMDITQTSKMGDSINVYVTNQVRQALSQVIPPDRLAKLMDGFSVKLAAAAPPSAVTDAAVPIYAKAFSMEDIQELVKFYESPLGQRVVKALPQVARESEELGVQMQQKGAMNVLEGMSGDYPELKQMLRPPDAAPEAVPGPEKAPAPAPQSAPTAPSK